MHKDRQSPIEINKAVFQRIGYQLVDQIAEFFESIREKPVTPGEEPQELQMVLGNGSIPENGSSPETIMARATELLFNHSLFNGHPKFFGYITSSPAPIGALADMLAATANPNVGAQILSPIATEIEKQAISWIAELIGVNKDCGGIFVSGGNMANFTGFLTGRTIKASRATKETGLNQQTDRLIVYCSAATHTWIEKAAVLFGLGSNAIRWIPADNLNKMDETVLELAIQKDLSEGYHPIMVIGTAGDVSTGAVDNLKALSVICKKYDLWFHVDGAYGIPAAAIPELATLFEGIEDADSIALDPHKWLYSPLEAGCTIVKNPAHLQETFSHHPAYYNFEGNGEVKPHNFYEYGLQNSRGFRALKVWMALQQVGRKGYIEMIREDIRLSKLLFSLAGENPELDAITQSLSIATFRYKPIDNVSGIPDQESYLNELNESLLNSLQKGGQLFLSNAVISGKYCLRACIVNFRTSEADIKEVIEIITTAGKKMHDQLQKVASTHA